MMSSKRRKEVFRSFSAFMQYFRRNRRRIIAQNRRRQSEAQVTSLQSGSNRIEYSFKCKVCRMKFLQQFELDFYNLTQRSEDGTACLCRALKRRKCPKEVQAL